MVQPNVYKRLSSTVTYPDLNIKLQIKAVIITVSHRHLFTHSECTIQWIIKQKLTLGA